MCVHLLGGIMGYTGCKEHWEFDPRWVTSTVRIEPSDIHFGPRYFFHFSDDASWLSQGGNSVQHGSSPGCENIQTALNPIHQTLEALQVALKNT